MNLRPVVEPATLTYVSVPRRKPVPVTCSVPVRYRPRSADGRFVSYSDLFHSMNVDLAFTNLEFDERDALPGRAFPHMTHINHWDAPEWGDWPGDAFDYFDIP